MEAGVHLPQLRFTDEGGSADLVVAVVQAARDLGFAAVSANDHLAFSRPWLDGPTLLARASAHAGALQLATTIALPSIRGPAALAATLATLDALAPGRVVAGVGPGSSSVDYGLARVPFAERWSRFDESVAMLRTLLRGEPVPESWGGPLPAGTVPVAVVATGPIPLWVASWGSPAGLRRVARLGDGWLASAYNTTPGEFGDARRGLVETLAERGRDPLPCALATMWTYVTEDPAEADSIVDDVLGPVLGRDPAWLRPRVCVGSVEHCATILREYAAAGCDRVYFWPVADEVDQLGVLAREVLPAVNA